MMQSMTGFGKAECELPTKVVTVEIKSLNSKQIDIYARIPNLYKEKELDLRNLLSKHLLRGKIEFCISYENTDATSSAQLNLPLIREYYAKLSELTRELNPKEGDTLLQTIMRFPDALKMDKEELDQEEWLLVVQKTEEALESVKKFRTQEGAALEKDILQRVINISDLLSNIAKFEGVRIDQLRERLTNNLKELAEQDKVDPNRFEQELIYYIEKIDITEEKVRLQNHCDFFRETAIEEDPVGKKLSFIAQEMGREINTIGSKANFSDIQRIVVQMKDELEKIKEQLMNVL
jgi:uncharacterized protein (TIGR00255 family)